MAKTSTPSRSSGTPAREGTPTPHALNDQMQIMQSLMEVQRELAVLTTQNRRLIDDINKLDDHVDAMRGKINRFEGITIAAIVLLAGFGTIIWWLIGDQLGDLRDQLYRYQVTIEQSQTKPAE